MTNSFDHVFDLVIVGSGAGSMPAALIARRAGKSVLVIEKAEQIGGSTAMSGGVMWIPNSSVMNRAGHPDSYEGAKTYFDACIGETTLRGASPARRHTYLSEGPRAVEFLEGLGMEFYFPAGYSDYYEGERPGGLKSGRAIVTPPYDARRLGDWSKKLRRHYPIPARMDELPPLLRGMRSVASFVAAAKVGFRMLRNRLGADLVGSGTALFGRMLEIGLREGVTIWLDSPVTGLIEQDGRIAGITARHEGVEVRIGATHGVLLDAGGFSRNAAMRAQHHTPGTASGEWTHANPGDTGEVMNMATALGAATESLDHAVWVSTAVLPDGRVEMVTPDLQKPHVVMVDSQGERYVNEATDYVCVGRTMIAHDAKGGSIPSWAIIESRARNRYFWAGNPPGEPPAAWIESGYMIKADSLDELAQRCGLDPERLKATITRFNGFARKGVDDDFGRGGSAFHSFFGDPANKPSATLGPIEQPPFYASKVFPGDVGTFGGLVTDEHARVLKEDGSIIPGLYAAGNITSSVMGMAYPGAGASIGPSFVFGYVAARHALGANA